MNIYRAKDNQGNTFEVNGREKNLLISIYEQIDMIASSEQWEKFWQDKYQLEPMNDWSSNRKFLWIIEENKWLYTDMQDIEIFPDNEIIEKFIEEAIQLVKDGQKQRSKFLEHLVPKKARQLLQAFNCFEFI